MGRVADSTIKGFMYQFNLSLNEILKSTDEVIKIEGIIEDIDKFNSAGVTAIQCKYHEGVDKFQWSMVYKPILQMLKTYVKMNEENISFVLYAFFPSEKSSVKLISLQNIRDMFDTTNTEYICDYIAYIKKATDPEILDLVAKSRKSKEDKEKIKNYFIKNKDDLEVACDLDEFINNRFTFRIGKGYDDLEKDNLDLLSAEGFVKADIDEIIYPNAIQKIASLSILECEENRNITKKEMILTLKSIKKTAISRWTKELKNYNQLLKRRRKQLGNCLNINYRKRCFVFDSANIECFEEKIVIFIKNYVDMYCCKPKLHIPAIISIIGYDKDKIDKLVCRLYQKGIEVETGYRGNVFYPEAFVKNPEKKVNESWMQFKIKICCDACECIEAINRDKQDDIFQVAYCLPELISIQDVNLEILDVNNLNQIEYLLKIRDEVEI